MKEMSGEFGAMGKDWIGWEKPSAHAVKVNMDGSVLGCNARTGVGVSIQHQRGVWLMGEARNMRCLNALTAELFAILYGLELAWK